MAAEPSSATDTDTGGHSCSSPRQSLPVRASLTSCMPAVGRPVKLTRIGSNSATNQRPCVVNRELHSLLEQPMETILISILAACAAYEYRHLLLSPLTLLILALGLPIVAFCFSPLL